MVGLPILAIIKSRTCRQRRHVQVRPVGPRNIRCCEAYFVEWHANTPPISQRTAARCVGAAAGMGRGGNSLWAFLRRGHRGTKGIQRPWVFGGVFAPFCRRGQKGVAPEREIFPPEAKKRKQNIGGGRGRTPPLRRDRRECASIRRCADAGRRGRRPLRAHPSGCSGKRGAGDFRAYGGQARA